MAVRGGSTRQEVAAPADEVFALVTDIDRLPEWNAAIQRVTEKPTPLAPGAQWCVELKLPGMPSWTSRSTLVELDRDARRFRYRTQTDDGNPSWTDWAWEVDDGPDGAGGADVRVSWQVHPETFVRKVLISRLRSRALGKEVPTSIAAVEAALTRTAHP